VQVKIRKVVQVKMRKVVQVGGAIDPVATRMPFCTTNVHLLGQPWMVASEVFRRDVGGGTKKGA